MKVISRRHLISKFGLSASCAIASAVSLLIAPSGSAIEKPLKVFIFAGQSNMLGQESKTKLLPYKLRGPQREVLIWQSGRWKTYTASMGQESGFGPEASCGFELATALREPVGMIKVSVGGSNLDKQWNPRATESIYLGLKKQVRSAMVSRQIEIVGMFWMQGESDALTVSMAMSYSHNLDALIAQARSDFRNQEMVFISGRISSRMLPYIDMVRRSQEKGRRKYGWINLDKLPKLEDEIHFDTRGIIEMGQLFAKKFTQVSSRY